MRTLSIESNGRLDKTAVYINAEQVGKIKELYLNLDESGTFDAILTYENKNGTISTKQLFTDYLDDLIIVEPMFSEEEAMDMQLLTIESSGDIEETHILMNNEDLDGIMSLMIHLKIDTIRNNGVFGFFKKNDSLGTTSFKAEIEFRNQDGTTSIEGIF